VLDADGVEFVQRDGNAIRSSIAVQPWRGALVVHDWHEGSCRRTITSSAFRRIARSALAVRAV
jgi:hypothetical protein